DRIAQLVADALQERQPQLLVRDLAPPEAQGDLHLVAVVQEAPDVAHLDVVVTVIGAGAELHLLDFDDLLLRLGFGSLLLFEELELAVFNQAAYRRIGGRNHLHQVHVVFTREAQGLLQGDHTQCLVLRPEKTHLRGHDLPVQAVLAFLALAAVAKCSSDGSILHQDATKKVALSAATVRPGCDKKPGRRPGPVSCQRFWVMSSAILWAIASTDMVP